MQHCLLVNPTAGDGQASQWLLDQTEALRQRGITLQRLECGADTPALIEQAIEAGTQRLIVAGGDGTVSGVVNALAPHAAQCELAILPIGTANDFARTINLPWDVEAALELTVKGSTETIDLIRAQSGEAEPRLLINAATGGFSRSAEGPPEADRKQFWGPLAYLRSAMEQLSEIPQYAMTLRMDDEVSTAEGCALIVANGRYAGGGMPLVPTAELNDHWLEIVAITADDALSRLKLTGEFLLGQHLNAEEGILHRRARRLTADADPTLHFSTDGEPIGQTPIHFEIVPNALRVVSGK